MKKIFFMTLAIVILGFGEVSAAHYVVGEVNNSVDGVLANGHKIMLWNPTYGQSDNLTDIIGPSGNSGVDNYYMIDCSALLHPCNVGNILMLRVLNTGDNHNSGNVSVTVTGAGYDVAPTLILNSPINVTSVTVDDSITSPPNQIDLITASTRLVTCTSVMHDPDGGRVYNASARFFYSGSTYLAIDDNNTHYTNSSCFVNSSYGAKNLSQVICTFNVWYYANSGNWSCVMKGYDNLSMPGNGSASTFVNPLLSVGVQSKINFGLVFAKNVSNEVSVNVTNYGNVKVNLSLYGYGGTPGDNLAMNCTKGSGIPINNERYNLTQSNPGNLTLSQFDSTYDNLSSNYTVRNFGLSKRTNNMENNAVNFTYWRIYLPPSVSGNCTGSVVFGASTSAGV